MEGIPILQDITFWHLLATVSGGLLMKMLNKHMEKTEETLKDIKEILDSVVTKNEVQEVRIEQVERRVEKLENG
jgi:polyhydroxyalkanoate synthesis regulator phasin